MTKLLGAMLIAFGISACDPDRHKECEWYLVPEPDHRELVKEGWVSLCARNYENNKQRCYLQAKISYAEKVYGTPFRFTSLKLDKTAFPRKIISIKACRAARKRN